MRRLMWIFVEGSDDRVFVDHVLRPILKKDYYYIDIWDYAQQTHEKTAEFIRSIRSVEADYLFLRDIDTCPCVTARKQGLLGIYGKRIDSSRTVVVVREIVRFSHFMRPPKARRKRFREFLGLVL